MNLSATLYIARRLIHDTFRQAFASSTFWLMLALSGLSIAFCLGVHIENGAPLQPHDEIELYGGDNQPLTGPNPRPGRMTLAFGLIGFNLFRDGETQVRFIQTILAFWIAGSVGLLATLIWTAGFLPAFVEPSAAAVLLAKPAPRWLLLGGKCLGVLVFVGAQETIFFGGTWLALGWRTGYWPATYLAAIPLVLFHFCIVYGASVVLAVLTRSTVISIFGAILFWLGCYGVNLAHHASAAQASVAWDSQSLPHTMTTALDATYWLLPKPVDAVFLLDQAVHGSDHFNVVPQSVRTVFSQPNHSLELSLVSSLLVSGLMIAFAAHRFAQADY